MSNSWSPNLWHSWLSLFCHVLTFVTVWLFRLACGNHETSADFSLSPMDSGYYCNCTVLRLLGWLLVFVKCRHLRPSWLLFLARCNHKTTTRHTGIGNYRTFKKQTLGGNKFNLFLLNTTKHFFYVVFNCRFYSGSARLSSMCASYTSASKQTHPTLECDWISEHLTDW